MKLIMMGIGGIIEIVTFPIKNGDFPWQTVSLPEGNSSEASEVLHKQRLDSSKAQRAKRCISSPDKLQSCNGHGPRHWWVGTQKTRGKTRGKDGKIWEDMEKTIVNTQKTLKKLGFDRVDHENWDVTHKNGEGSTNNTLLEAVANKSAGNGGLNATSATVDTIDLNRHPFGIWVSKLDTHGYPKILWYHVVSKNCSPLQPRFKLSYPPVQYIHWSGHLFQVSTEEVRLIKGRWGTTTACPTSIPRS